MQQLTIINRLFFLSKYNCFFYNTNYILSLYIANTSIILTINISIKKLKNKNIFTAYILYILS